MSPRYDHPVFHPVTSGDIDAATASIGDVVLAHDALDRHSGDERVALELARLWPRAPMYTSVYRPEQTYEGFERVDLVTSFVNKMRLGGRLDQLSPLVPAAFRSFDRVDADVLVSSARPWSRVMRTTPDTLHISYVHTPARALWNKQPATGPGVKGRFRNAALNKLREIDRNAVGEPDLYVVNSEHTQRSLRRIHGIESVVVPPPVDIDRFTASARGERLLVVSPLEADRGIDAVIVASNVLGIGLDIVGTGPLRDELRDIAGSHVRFHGEIDDDELTGLMQSCRAYVLAGLADFGSTPVEAHAAGKPVIAFRGGGALDTVEEGFSGIFVDRWDHHSLTDAIRAVDELAVDPLLISTRARRFSPPAFRVSLLTVIARAQERQRAGVAA